MPNKLRKIYIQDITLPSNQMLLKLLEDEGYEIELLSKEQQDKLNSTNKISYERIREKN